MWVWPYRALCLQVFQKELGARSSSHTSVIKAGKELMKSKQGEDKSILKSKMADLDHEWTNVYQMSTAYQHKLENALKKVRTVGHLDIIALLPRRRCHSYDNLNLKPNQSNPG